MNAISSLDPNRATVGKTTEGKTPGSAHEKKVTRTCADFEAMLTFQMLKAMRQSIPNSGLLKSSHGQDAYEMLMDQKIAEEIAHKGEGLGVRRVLYDQISQNLQKKVKVPDGK
jgi:flagellar protein FlgJ